MKGEMPDRVPVSPDISNMVPCRLTGKPFWDIYLYNDPPLWKAYIKAVEYYGFDAWFIYGHLDLETNSEVEYSHEIIERTPERIVRRTVIRTAKGELTRTDLFRVGDPPVPIECPVKSPDDLPRYFYLLPEIKSYRTESLEQMRMELGDKGVLGVSVSIPGIQNWIYVFEGGVETATYLYLDRPELIYELCDIEHSRSLRLTEMVLESKPDFVLIGASGLMTFQSPEVFRDLSLPTIKAITSMCRQAGIPSMIHSCGRERELVRICVEETELDCINPLEHSPMGDCDLAELKELWGDRITLMGNIHTTFPMLRGSPDDVRSCAIECLESAMHGGRYILSTGDQCGRDTPDENLFALREVAEEYGKYR